MQKKKKKFRVLIYTNQEHIDMNHRSTVQMKFLKKLFFYAQLEILCIIFLCWKYLPKLLLRSFPKCSLSDMFLCIWFYLLLIHMQLFLFLCISLFILILTWEYCITENHRLVLQWLQRSPFYIVKPRSTLGFFYTCNGKSGISLWPFPILKS